MSMNRSLPNRHVLATTLIASVGGLLFGFDTAVIAGTTNLLTAVYHLSAFSLGITVSGALWGTVAGAASAGLLSDKFGRRTCLRGLGLLYLVSALGCAFAWGWYPLLCFRVLVGIAIGASSVISPTYIAEISPAVWRGRLVGAFQFNVVFGMLLAYLSNYLVGLAVHDNSQWRWMLGMAVAPALAFWILLFFIPESPRWLVSGGRSAEALAILTQNDPEQARAELAGIEHSLVHEKSAARESVFQLKYKLPIFLAISIGMFNQLSGINAILYYLNSIFESAGFDRPTSSLQAVLIGLTNLVAVTIALMVIDRLGRRSMLLIGSVGTAVCLAGVATIFHMHAGQRALVWLLVGFIGFFSFSQGAVIWVYISEIFPNRVRAKGQSIGSFTHWFMNAVVAALFPVLAAAWGSVPFYFFASMMALQFFVVLYLFPETRGLRLEEMESVLHSQAPPNLTTSAASE